MKDKYIRIRLTQEEDEQLRKNARDNKMTITQYVITRCAGIRDNKPTTVITNNSECNDTKPSVAKPKPAFIDKDLLRKQYADYKYQTSIKNKKPSSYEEWLKRRK